ncbi:MAG: S-layer homology domain-containing protein [Oscillospiraceae bacterium]|jgi:hypothetical protein|nr:S-layer homology domain-containing protein [Oscillospiraceae bacterium]
MKKFLCAVLTAAALAAGVLSPARAAAPFTDVPPDSWAAEVITSAADAGLMGGVGDGKFGYGKTVTRAEFVTVLCRMLGWALITPETPSFSDVPAGQWYFPYIETALARGAIDGGNSFAPQAPIRRADMAVTLVRVLGYKTLAEQLEKSAQLPFTDVREKLGYIAVARDIGMINGMSATTFAPENTATREQAAAMLVRVYDKYTAKIGWLHGFYALSSYAQRYTADSMDGVSFGWSVMRWDGANGARLDTSLGDWKIPESYESATGYLEQRGVPAHLGVYMDASGGLAGLLASPEAREQAAAAILGEVTRVYDAIGKSPYSGVTVDFEGLRAAQKADFTAFLTPLSLMLKAEGLSLYVTVQPVTADGVYFDGYDYRAIGRLADKVILMAHNYAPATLDGFVGTEWQKNAPLTPLAEIYCALQAITDPVTGVEDADKIALALSFSAVGWHVTEDGRVAFPEPVYPSLATVAARLRQIDTVSGWSEAYRNPYILYRTESGERIFLWYEDARSISEKLALARLFGVTGASVWRIGSIPDFDGYNVWETIAAQR